MADTTNEFDGAAAQVMQSQASTIRNNVYNAVPQNPATVAEHSKIAGVLGIPVESVASDPTVAKQQAAMQNFDASKVVSNYPHLAQFLSDPLNAAKSHTDLPTLASTEQAVKSLPNPNVVPDFEGNQSKPEQGAGAWLLSNAQSIPDLPMSLAKGIGSNINDAAHAVNMAIAPLPGAYDFLASKFTGKETHSLQDTYFKNFVDPLEANKSLLSPGVNDTMLQKLTHGVGGLLATILEIAGTGGMSEVPAVVDAAAPAMKVVTNAMEHAVKSMAFPSITAAINTGNEVYQKTGSVSDAIKAATVAYGTNTAMGVAPIALEGNLAKRVASGFPIGALTGEVNRQASNASLPDDMQAPANIENTIINGLTGSILAGTMGHPGSPVDEAIRQNYQEAHKIEQATQTRNIVEGVADLAQKSDLLKHDPQAFHDFISSVSDDGQAPKELWINGQSLVDSLHQSGITEDQFKAQLPDAFDQLHEALQTGGDVRIPLADYATHISVSPLNDVIMDYLKTDPEGLTYKQGQQLLVEQKESMTAQAQDLVKKTAALDERSRQLKAITDDVQRQLEATGRFPTSVARDYSALHGAWYDTMADRMGISPAELRERMPLTIQAEGQEGSVFHQAQLADQQIEKWAKGNLIDGEIVKVGNPSETLKKFGVSDVPIHLTKSILDKAVKHGLNPNDLVGVAHAIQNPLAVFASKHGKGNLVVLTELRHEDGNIIAAIDLNKMRDKVDIHDIRSIHPKADASITHWINDGLLLGYEKTKGKDWLERNSGSNSPRNQLNPALVNASVYENKSLDNSYKQDKNLIAQHNLSSENLLHADRIGGLPVPSLAVTTKENPIKGYGDITLLADKGLVNPKSGAKVFGSDIYSPRYPEIDVKLDKYALKGLNDKLKEFQDGKEIYSGQIESAKDLVNDKAFEKYAESKGINRNSYHALKALAEQTLRDVGAKERIFKGRNDNGYAQYADHTIDNVVKILKKDLRGGENFNYGVGNIRSKVAPQFKSIEEIKKSKDLLVSEEAFDKVKEEINNEFFNVAEGLQEFHPSSSRFGFLDTVSMTMQDAATMGLPKALKENGFNDVPEAKQKEVVEFMNKLKDLPTAYFEAKVLRSVGLDEFKGAVVPYDVDPKVIKALNDKGITDIKTYQSGDEADRTAKIGEFEHLLFQESRGTYSPEAHTMALLKNADLSTFLHESGHFFLEGLHDLAKSPEAPEGIKQDFDTLLQHFKVPGETPEERMANWSAMDLNGKREGHESFANGFEDYLMTGKAPVPELQSLFSRFRSWLLNLYKSLCGEVSPEVKGVMDRMLASEQSIAEAEKIQAYAIPDLPADHGALVDEYKKLGKEATDQAISDMQARSMRDLKWATNAKNKVIKSMQRQAVEQREAIRREVTPEVMKQPIYRAWNFLTVRGEPDSQVLPQAKSKANPKEIDPYHDSLFTAIAKLGGLQEKDVANHWGVARKEIQSSVFGKPVVRKEGGLPIDRMAESLEHHGYLNAHDLEEFENKFDAENRGDPQYSLHNDSWYRKDEPVQALDLEHQYHGKLNTEDLRYMFGQGKDAVWKRLSDLGMTSEKKGIDPQIVAETFGFNSARDLVKELAEAPNPHDVIKGLVDQRMLERHGDLTDPVSVERAAEGAIHNEVRAKMMATGLKMFTKSPMSVREINQAAKIAAETAVAQKQVGDLRPTQYAAAEAKANKELLRLAPKDPEGAAKTQREALLNNRLFKASTDAVADVQKGLTYFKRFNKESLRSKIDVDVRDQIDNLLARFDLRQNPTDEPTRAQMNLEKWINSQMEAGYSPTVTAEMLAPEFRKPYRNMTVEEFRGLVDTIKSIEHIGRQRNMLTIEGQKQQVADYVKNELIPKLQERGERFSTDEIYTRPEDRDISKFTFAMDKISSGLRALHAQLTPQEYKRNALDRHDILGPFGKAIFDPIIDANYNKVRMLKGLSDDFSAMAEKLGKDWQKSLNEFLHNDKLIDAIATKETGSPVFMKMSRGKMIGMAIHVGNESNFHKLTGGYEWEPAKVWEFLHDNMTAKDWEAVQHVWDLYEKHWPDMQAMYRRLGQTTPDKVEARSFHTPFGEMRGGYAAIKYDALRSRRGEKDAAGQAINPSEGLFNRDYFSRSSTSNGSMNKRIEGYTDAIDLNFHTIERSLHESIHDLAYREALIDANKIIENADFRREFFKAYGREEYRAMQDWIGRIANSDNSDRAVGALGRFLQYTRTGMVMNAIALRATTVLKHGGSAGIKTAGYFMGGGQKYLASRIAAMGHDYTNQIASAKEKFGEINARLLQQDRDYKATASSLFEPESVKSKAERFGHAAVAWSDMMTAVPTAWAAYDRAITEGIPVDQGGTGKPMTEKQAVAYANKIVREAHGSNVESARSNIMTAPSEAIKMFTTLYGFMNNTYGQMADSVNKFQTPGMNKPEILARTFMAIIVPAIWAGWLTEGGLKEGESAFEWAAKAITGDVAGTVPMVRDAYAMVEGYRNAGVVGAESWLSTLTKAGGDVVKVAQGKEPKKLVADVADAIGMGLHIPGLGQIGKSAQYIRDVSNGEQNPANALEYAQGMLVGTHKK